MSEPMPTTLSISTYVYPCDYGTGRPMGYHHFEAGASGIAVCRYCGKRAAR